MNLLELMNTKPEDLAKLQHDKLKEHVLGVLGSIYDLIKDEKYETLIKGDKLFDSPSGDSYGKDNKCIDFKYGHEELDIEEVLSELSYLKMIIEDKVT